jgi:hypothetical protein
VLEDREGAVREHYRKVEERDERERMMQWNEVLI